jgi:Tol biopolymer transport system component
LWVVEEDGSNPRRVTNDSARETYPAWSSKPGDLYYVSNRDESPDLWRARFDERTGALSSAPERLTRGWFGAPVQLAAARERERLAFVHEVDLSQTWVLELDVDGQPLGPPRRSTLDLPFEASLPQLSPSGDAWIVAARRANAENLRVVGSRVSRWVTDGPARDAAPRWSPDGASIAFHSDRSGTTQIWTVHADGTGLRQITAGAAARYPVWSPDGTQIAYTAEGSGAWIQTLDAGSAARLLDGFEPWSWSADGRRLAGTARGIVVDELDDGRLTRLTDRGERPSWAGDTGALYFTREERIFRWSGSGEPQSVWSSGPNSLLPGMSLSPSGREIVFSTAASRERVWLFDPEPRLTD